MRTRINAHIEVANDLPFVLFGGLNVLADREQAFEVCSHFQEVTHALGIPYVFKASFDKANRSSMDSFRGLGLEKGLQLLADIKSRFDVPIITDIHEPLQADVVSQVADVLQIPAFLARQTDLVVAAARTGSAINFKKPQFMSPPQVKHLVGKCREAGNDRVMICERGASFGYDNLVVDMLGFRQMDEVTGGAPVIFDVTHSLQCRNPLDDASGGRRRQIVELARAGMAAGIGGLFLEAHPDPDNALCDGPSALPLHNLQAFLEQMKQIDDVVKRLPKIDIK
ncbi:3-deoxy-8-phosphooctulonate synthase [Paraburkholderia bannensis]|uniref:3-deoxy-8-phosphooctulonate synthase n=1 Tax=Paraburkholderia tropica TaxID=92647 RepID=UPI000F5406AC|nr:MULTISPECIES: 3-deoxy-8-phosphooctulonate synthase [Paraburkholderia]MBB6322282.1 2-dehydro-3-deoxyphosphooctonate aldolase (KDO 8-P synthase) [Paraburkholderia tropica]QNB12248.1 3-deoxy-8-phosphooctulonate synthase [Paraburkholderia tropica]RQM49610.1 3-deoxy-8-phosphooctulonate synthase [Paraburkholderia bannensis]